MRVESGTVTVKSRILNKYHIKKKGSQVVELPLNENGYGEEINLFLFLLLPKFCMYTLDDMELFGNLK